MEISAKYINPAAIQPLLFSFGAVHASLPTTLDYQGFLTDSTGQPVDGTVSITFSHYDVEAGGSALWTSPKTVSINQGVFSVELGAMSPRRPITSTGFAFKADDANTLEGVSASTLDQSEHVSDTNNPHNVTAS